ncbi:MAG: phosphoadenosine phosphosulfate reductase family protein [Euryarchaeota archaeon]|nr:phosphoadenosine phosphosulfate reductase family protein [Euryarchaeota archaeon]
MGAVRLGRVHLHWCRECNLPLAERGVCAVCGSEGTPLPITPPGDVRPAFPADVESVRRVFDGHFGKGCGQALIAEGRVVLLNKAPSVDRMIEIVSDGVVLGSVRHDPGEGDKAILRPAGGRRIEKAATRSYVIADDGAVPSILKGSSLLAPGVIDCDINIKKGDEVIVLTRERKAISVGIARMSGAEMRKNGHGAAAKNRASVDETTPVPLEKANDWARAVEANRKVICARAAQAANFIKRRAESDGLLVSFSGGKDSLAVLLLALDAGLRPPMLFVDTGIEMPETVAYVSEIAAKYELDLIIESAGEVFWHGVEHFGPPAKDFRWCCKTCKLAPIAKVIGARYPEGVTVFVGQRRYESEPRARHGSLWENPWVPGQRAASPIQDWTALHVWLYIFMKGAPYNVWYERGMDRIGCFPCPAADIADIGLMRAHHEGQRRWDTFLAKYAELHGLPKDWLDKGLWRWLAPPEELSHANAASENAQGSSSIQSPSQSSVPKQRQVSPGSLGRAGRFMNIIGGPRDEGGFKTSGGASLSPDGKLFGEQARIVFVKAEHCLGCGLCVARCPQGALFISDGMVDLDESKCSHCGICISPCPVVDFEPRMK